MAQQANKYQEAIFEEIQKGTGNIVIEALAGAGKTTTIVNALKLIPSSKKVMFIAFNTSIVAELKERVGSMNNVLICTLHSLGMRMLFSKLKKGEFKVNEFKYSSFIDTTVRAALYKRGKDNSEVMSAIKSVTQLVNMGRNFLAKNLEDMKSVAERFDINCTQEDMTTALAVMDWGKNNLKEIDFTDMIWLPNVLTIDTKCFRYDYIFLDEAQDANVAQVNLFLKCKKLGTRVVAVGDKNQSIYSFAGAVATSFDMLKQLQNTKTLPLNMSFRCPKSVAVLAQEIIPQFEVKPDAIEGSVNYNVDLSEIKEDGMVLCRNNAPLMQLFISMLSNGQKAYMNGSSDLFKSLIKMVSNVNQYKLSVDLSEDGVIPRLYMELFNNRDKMCNVFKIKKEQATTSGSFYAQFDMIHSIITLSMGLQTKDQLLNKLEQLMNNPSSGVCLSSIHKAKGMENDNVYILCPSMMPSSRATKDWEIQEEENLRYVAYTRAKKSLNFLNEEGFEVDAQQPKEFAERMENIEMVINKLTNRTVYHIKSATVDESFVDTIEALSAKTENNVAKTSDTKSVGTTFKVTGSRSKIATRRKRAS